MASFEEALDSRHSRLDNRVENTICGPEAQTKKG